MGDKDLEYFIVVSLDWKNQPVSINFCHIGSLNAGIVHPREVMKSAILSNASSETIGEILDGEMEFLHSKGLIEQQSIWSTN